MTASSPRWLDPWEDQEPVDPGKWLPAERFDAARKHLRLGTPALCELLGLTQEATRIWRTTGYAPIAVVLWLEAAATLFNLGIVNPELEAALLAQEASTYKRRISGRALWQARRGQAGTMDPRERARLRRLSLGPKHG